jgi:hypothetical protein
MFSYNITWGATKKEVERSNFFIEVPRILKRFWLAFLFSFGTLAGMVILTTDLPPLGWRIPGYDWAVIIPLLIVCVSHILWPVCILRVYSMYGSDPFVLNRSFSTRTSWYSHIEHHDRHQFSFSLHPHLLLHFTALYNIFSRTTP